MRGFSIAIALVACSKDERATTAGPNARDAVIAAWKAGGLQVSALAPADVPAGKDCQAGTVNDVDVVLCAFGSADEAKAAQEAGLAWVGSATGLSRARGAVLILAADRKKRDPNGRTINQLVKLAPE